MIVNNNEDLHRCRLSMRCKYGAHGAVEPGQDAVSPALPMLTDEAVPKKHIGTFEAHLANVRHFFVFARQHSQPHHYFLHLTTLLTCLVRIAP